MIPASLGLRNFVYNDGGQKQLQTTRFVVAVMARELKRRAVYVSKSHPYIILEYRWVCFLNTTRKEF